MAQQVVSQPVTSGQLDVPEPISTERPTVGPSPDLIPAGSLQVENGVGVSLQGSQYLADLPEAFLRVGLTKHWELRVLASNLVYQSSHAVGTSSLGSQDAAISTKMLVSAPNRLLPKSAIFNLSMPTGSKPNTSGSYDPMLALIWTQTDRHGYFLNEVAQATLSTFFGARRSVWAPSVAGGRSLTPHLTGFAEYAPTLLPDHTVPYTVDGGVAYAAKGLQQFDCRTGFTQDSGGRHMLLSVGYSIRRDQFMPKFR